MEFLFANKSSMLFVLGAGLMIFILMRRWNRYFRKQKPMKRDSRRKAMVAREPNKQQPLLDAPPEVLRWQVEMHDIARDVKAELDTKIAVLQRLVIDAREEADRLEAVIEKSQQQAIG